MSLSVCYTLLSPTAAHLTTWVRWNGSLNVNDARTRKVSLRVRRLIFMCWAAYLGHLVWSCGRSGGQDQRQNLCCAFRTFSGLSPENYRLSLHVVFFFRESRHPFHLKYTHHLPVVLVFVFIRHTVYPLLSTHLTSANNLLPFSDSSAIFSSGNRLK